MKTIQTFWTKPGKDIGGLKYWNCGWQTVHQHYYSWVLSSMLAHKNYGRVDLMTDSLGARALIEKLKLPYTVISTDLDNIDVPLSLWRYAKVFTYSKQREPFIHLSSDVYLWKSLPEYIFSAAVFVQHVLRRKNIGYSDDYDIPRHEIIKHLPELPNLIYDDDKCDRAYNMGIFGGNDLNSIKYYCDTVKDVLLGDDNTYGWSQFGTGSRKAKTIASMNNLIERMLAFIAFKEIGLEPVSLYKSAIDDDQSIGLGYTHVMNHKSQINLNEVGYKLAKRIEKEYPQQYEAIQSWLGTEKQP